MKSRAVWVRPGEGGLPAGSAPACGGRLPGPEVGSTPPGKDGSGVNPPAKGRVPGSLPLGAKERTPQGRRAPRTQEPPGGEGPRLLLVAATCPRSRQATCGASPGPAGAGLPQRVAGRALSPGGSLWLWGRPHPPQGTRLLKQRRLEGLRGGAGLGPRFQPSMGGSCVPEGAPGLCHSGGSDACRGVPVWGRAGHPIPRAGDTRKSPPWGHPPCCPPGALPWLFVVPLPGCPALSLLGQCQLLAREPALGHPPHRS